MTAQRPGERASSEELRNPLRNEGDAFRLLAQILIAALAVIAVGALISSAAGLALAAVLLVIGVWRAGKWLRAWLAMPADQRQSSDR